MTREVSIVLAHYLPLYIILSLDYLIKILMASVAPHIIYIPDEN